MINFCLTKNCELALVRGVVCGQVETRGKGPWRVGYGGVFRLLHTICIASRDYIIQTGRALTFATRSFLMRSPPRHTEEALGMGSYGNAGLPYLGYSSPGGTVTRTSFEYALSLPFESRAVVT